MNRNIRAAYLNSLGFQEAGIQYSLDQLLAENVIDLEKLRKLCLRFEVPTKYKCTVWKLLLGVIPPFRETWAFVQQQRIEQYEDLKRTTTLLASTLSSQLRDSNSIGDQIYYIRQKIKMSETENDDDDSGELLPIARMFARICDTEYDAYFCFDKFLLATVEKFGSKAKSISYQISLLTSLLRHQDSELIQHLEQTGITLEQFSYTWFRSNFATLCTDWLILESLLCKVIAISYQFSACVALSFLTHIRQLIVVESDPNNIKKTVKSVQSKFVTEYSSILNKALDIFTNVLPSVISLNEVKRCGHTDSSTKKSSPE